MNRDIAKGNNPREIRQRHRYIWIDPRRSRFSASPTISKLPRAERPRATRATQAAMRTSALASTEAAKYGFSKADGITKSTGRSRRASNPSFNPK